MGRKKRKKGPAITPPMMERIYYREKGRCFWCKTPVYVPWKDQDKIHNGVLQPNHGTKDHLLPKSKGGTTEMHNVVLSCMKCNNSKGSYLINPATGDVICPTVLWIFLKEGC
jgi:5-methylcytosine-specific restriction endonuclease McrA